MKLDELKKVFLKYDRIDAAYVYGSAATGKLKPYSDIDVALLLAEPFSSEEKDKLLTDIICDIESAFRHEADVKVMNTMTHLPLLHEILANGVLLCDRQPNVRRDFAIKKNREYLDFLPHYQRMLDTYAERIRKRDQTKSSVGEGHSN